MINDITAQEARKLTFQSVANRRLKSAAQQEFDALVEELSLKIQHYAAKGVAKLTYRLSPYNSATMLSLMRHFKQQGFTVTARGAILILTW